MQVRVENKPITLFRGAVVADALTAFCEATLQDVRRGKLLVTDGEGHPRSLSGELREGDVLKLQPAQEKVKR